MLETKKRSTEKLPPRSTHAFQIPSRPPLVSRWWRGEDSNLRRQSRQIYSLIPLAAREPLQKSCSGTANRSACSYSSRSGKESGEFCGSSHHFVNKYPGFSRVTGAMESESCPFSPISLRTPSETGAFATGWIIPILGHPV